MQSPFAIFRKHQRVALAAVTLMAMFAFVFMGTIDRSTSQSNTSAKELAVETKAGNLTRSELQTLVFHRNLANRFVEVAFVETHQELARFAQFLDSQLRQHLFRFGRETTQSDVLLGYLLRQEGHRMGLVVSDDQIEAYIDQITEKKLSSAQFMKIVKQLNVSPKQLYNVLRDELAAQAALRFSAPLNPQTPEQYWEFYKQLHVRQKLEVAAVPVVAFTGQVSSPSSTELEDFFNQHKSKYETVEEGTLKPGFRQPRKVALQYAEASFEAARERVAKETPVTDQDVEEFYEKNKETTYKINTIPSGNDASEPLNPEFEPDHGKKDTESAPDDKPKPEEAPEGSEEKKPEAKPDGSKPDEPKPDAPKADAPKPGESKPDDAKPEKTEEKADAPENQPEGKPEKKPADEKQPQAAARPSPISGTEAERVAARSILTALAVPGEQLVLAATEDEKPKADGDKPKTDSTDAPAAKTEPAADKDAKTDKDAKAGKSEKKPETPADAPEKTEPEKKEPEKKEPEKKESDKSEPDQPDAEKKGEPGAEESAEMKKEGEEKEDAAPAPPLKYRPLDDELKQQIRDELLRERTARMLGDQVQKIISQMQDEGYKFTSKYVLTELKADQSREFQTDAEKVLKGLAEKAGMKYGETGLVSAFELNETPGIGKAHEPSDNPMAPGGSATLLDQVFISEQLCVPNRVEDPATNDLYVYWKVADVAPHVPKFDETGVASQVEKTWRRLKAEPIAKERAKSLADTVRKSGQTLQKVLEDLTITGEKDDVKITVHETPEFTWMRESPARSFNPFAPSPPPTLSDPVFVDKPGQEFMRVVFDDLKGNEIGVAPNADSSVFYVVKVVSRLAADREEFMKAHLFGRDPNNSRFSLPTPYDQLAMQQQQLANYRYSLDLERKYNVKWHTETESELEAAGPDEV